LNFYNFETQDEQLRRFGEYILKEIRIHGRGGQGVILAAELLIMAAFNEGKFGQAFPAFGGERRGAPVQAFVRIDLNPIHLRHRVNYPDLILVLDQTILGIVDVMQGLHPDGLLLVNSTIPESQMKLSNDAYVITVPAFRIAQDVIDQPIVNTAILGALSAVTDIISIDSILKAIQQRFPAKLAEMNCRVSQAAFEWIQSMEIIPRKVVGSRNPPVVTPWKTIQGLGAPGQALHFAAVVSPRSALAYPTGTWRYYRPVFNPVKCNACGICAMFCPDNCIYIENKKYFPDYEYCKGCGICAQECPSDAIELMPED
jgi:pyruvate ferredoxin oxidoreductase gamma subunit